MPSDKEPTKFEAIVPDDISDSDDDEMIDLDEMTQVKAPLKKLIGGGMDSEALAKAIGQ